MAECDAGRSPTVSVCLITCNGVEFVREQLRSILTQMPGPDELVVSDDASADGTPEAVEQLAHAGSCQVRFLRNSERLGVTANLQRAIEATTGQIVLFSDQDDVWKPGKIARITAELAADPGLGMVFSDADLIDRAGQPLAGSLWQRLRFGPEEQSVMNGGDALDVILRHNVVTGATVGVRRSLLLASLPFPTVGWHDHWLALYAAASDVPIRAIGSQLLSYRLHGANAAGLPSRSPRQWWGEQATAWRRREAIVSLLDELMARLPDAPHDVRDRIELATAFLRHRQQLPRNPIARAWAVSRWARGGQYRQFADGIRSVSLDLCLPQRPGGP